EFEIMWYDAMVENGARSFQNALTTQNDAFMKEGTALVSHSMFLNFWWGSFFNDSTKMPNSRQLALQLGIDPYDIYAGIDTEGGGYHTNVDWTSLFPEGQPHRLSLGIYRPEWTFNSTSNPTDFQTRDLRYWVGPNGDPSNTTTTEAWKGIAHYIPEQSPIDSLPFVTHFNVGQGTRYAVAGTNRGDRDWTNLSLQDILPTYRWMVESSGTKLVPTLDLDDAYEGGTSLKVSGNLSSPNILRLYRTNLAVTAQTNLRIAFKRGVAGPSALQVGLSFDSAPTEFTYLDVGNALTNSWNTKVLPLGEFAGRKIVAINLRFANGTAISGYAMRIGQLAIYDGAVTAPSIPTGLVIDHQESVDVDTLSLRLRWTHSAAPLHHYDVFVRHPDGTRVWLGATPSNVYFVPAARRKGAENSMVVEVEAVSPTFARSAVTQVSAIFPARPSVQYRLTGTVIGTTGSYQNNGRTRNNVFDQNTATFFDGPTADDVWAGLDLGPGNERSITAIRYYPRSAWSRRMLGGVFQASDSADFSSNVVTLASLPLTPVEGVYSTIAVSDPRRFRYVRYLSPDGSHGNVAEVSFYGVPLPAAPVSVTGTMIDGTTTLTWPAAGFASAYEVKRASSPNGQFTVVAANHSSTTFTEAGLTPSATYYYVVTALNQAGRSSESAPAIVKDGYRQWVVQQGWTPGTPQAEFTADADSDGLENGVEYVAPGGLEFSTAGQTSTIQVDLRMDARAAALLQRTVDMKTWAPVTLTLAPDQSGVPAGFERWLTQEPLGPSAGKRFYRLRINR
ncbi:MAG: endo-beta-N-acetylglucosaminidase, partial [Chthoniobacteraceae bacterium]